VQDNRIASDNARLKVLDFRITKLPIYQLTKLPIGLSPAPQARNSLAQARKPWEDVEKKTSAVGAAQSTVEGCAPERG
jgi:hypothetical protein